METLLFWQVVDDAFDAVFDVFLAEVEQEAEAFVGKAKVGQELLVVEGL
jgi:hypothetical protein